VRSESAFNKMGVSQYRLYWGPRFLFGTYFNWWIFSELQRIRVFTPEWYDNAK